MMRMRVGPLVAVMLGLALAGCGVDRHIADPGSVPGIDVRTSTIVLNAERGTTKEIFVQVIRYNYRGAVTVSAANVPAGMTATFDPVLVQPTVGSSKMTLVVGPTTATGDYTITLRVQATGVPSAVTSFVTVVP